jgi:hypothetical protein
VAAYNDLRVRLQSQRLDQEAAAARVEAEMQQARLRAEADEELARQGLVADMTKKISRSAADELANRVGIEGKRLAIGQEAIAGPAPGPGRRGRAARARWRAPAPAAAREPQGAAGPGRRAASRWASRWDSRSPRARTWRAWRSPTGSRR